MHSMWAGISAMSNIAEFANQDCQPNCAAAYIWPVIERLLGGIRLSEKRAFDVGCGNGAMANKLSQLAFEVTGVDPSETGVAQAQKAFPHLRVATGSGYDDLAARFGTFPLVISLEVIEHCYYPRKLAKTCFDLLAPGGVLILSTPYHGYLKNLALGVFGQWDRHADPPLWDGGHIKLFSAATFTRLLTQTGFFDISVYRAGRIPPLAKTMIAVGHKTS
jgi:SAM-dependent methyltransferase